MAHSRLRFVSALSLRAVQFENKTADRELICADW